MPHIPAKGGGEAFLISILYAIVSAVFNYNWYKRVLGDKLLGDEGKNCKMLQNIKTEVRRLMTDDR